MSKRKASYNVPSQDPKTLEVEARLREAYATQDEAKQAAGRYTLEEAAATLESAVGEQHNLTLTKLVNAVGAGTLPAFAPGQHARMLYDDPSHVRTFYEEVFWDDLNEWLANFDSRVQYRFPQPEHCEAIAHGVDRRPKRRRDILSPIIDRAIDATDGSTPDVYIWLKEQALNEAAPLTGVDSDGAILYANGKNKKVKLTRNALYKRLKRADHRQ